MFLASILLKEWRYVLRITKACCAILRAKLSHPSSRYFGKGLDDEKCGMVCEIKIAEVQEYFCECFIGMLLIFM